MEETTGNDAYKQLVRMCRRVQRGDDLENHEMARIIAVGESVGIPLGDMDPRKYCESILRTVDTAWKKQPVDRSGIATQDCNVLLILAKNLDPRDYAKFAQTSKAIYNCLDTGQYNPDETHRIRNMLREKKHAYFSQRDPIVNIGLMDAARTGDRDLVDLFISKGARAWSVALAAAAEGGHLDLVKFFVAKGVNTPSLNYALQAAAGSGNINLVKYFLTEGATNLDAALTRAVEKRQQEMVKYLISKGAKIITKSVAK